MKPLICLIAALLLLFPAAVRADKPTLHVVADEWPPFSGAALPDQGLSLHVISAVFERAGYPVKTDVLPWARIMDGARRSEFDVIGSLFFDPELTEFLSYADPFYATQVQLVERRGGGHSFTTVSALRPFSIAVGDGFLYEDEFDRADYLNKITVTTTLQALRMVAFGRADLTLDSVDVVNHAIHTIDPALADQLEIVPGVMTSQNIHMAMRKDHPQLDTALADFNTALRAMKADGTLEALLAQHVAR
ncbi:MAG: transporter substrate-binding domain-containing protein [Pseudomonadota bacterium]